MSWIVQDRRNKRLASNQPHVTPEMRRHVSEVLMPRYPTKRACLLPTLHLVQHEYGWIPPEALVEVADLLELAPAEVLDTATFYEEYWLKKKGKYLVQVCRSLACEVCGSDEITRGLCDKLGIEVGETTDDERYTIVELECMGSCGTAPVAMVNEVLLENATLEGVSRVIDQLPDDPHDYHDPSVEFEVPHGQPPHGTYNGTGNVTTTPAADGSPAPAPNKTGATGDAVNTAPAAATETTPADDGPAKIGTTGETSPESGNEPGRKTTRRPKRGGKKKSGKKPPKKSD